MKSEFSAKVYKSTNARALFHLTLPLALVSLGIYLSEFKLWSFYFLPGQFLLGIFFFQCFILLHETGHFSYFGNRFLNKFFGYVFGFLSFIPFTSWVEIHNLHHKWTGYRDRDPTTEGTVRPKFGPVTKLLVNASWLLWIPLFTIGYRLGNYWKLSKLGRYLPKHAMSQVYINIALQLTGYILLFYFFGWWMLTHLLLGYVISLMISDLFILSQHSHIEIPIAGEKEVKSIRYAEQVPYTRSLALSKYVGRFIYLNFNLHELHHAYPGLPAYHLDKVDESTPNKVGFFPYLKDAKGLSGMEFVFNTSKKIIGKR